MGGCCCSARKSHLQGTPVYYYCPPTFEERESLTSNDGTTSFSAGFLVGLNLEASIPDTFQPPPVPLPYDVVLGGSASTDSESGRETVSSFETLITREDIEESDCKAKLNSAPISPRKEELLKSNETHVLVTEEEDVCPICLEEYDVENPRNLTKCEHHFHLSCILEWMERSDSCPICDQIGVDSIHLDSCNLKFIACKCFIPTPEKDFKKRVEIKSVKIGKEKVENNAGESGLSSAETTPNGEAPLFPGQNSLETAELHHAPTGLVDTVVDYTPINGFQDAKVVFSVESMKLWSIAGPIAFNILCNYAVNSFTNIFVGHLGDLELSAVSVSLSVISNFSFGFLLGMASALETLCGQAFGAGQVEMLGVYMQRSWIILFGACVCLLPIYIYSERILILLGQDHQIAELAGVFTLQSIPQMFSLAVNFPTQKFLQAQSKVGFLAWLGFVALVIHIIMLYILIKVCALGTTGAAAAYCITAWLIAIAQTAYVVGWCKDGWRGLSWLAFKDLWAFVKLSVASAIMLCLEVWYFMILIVLTGHLDNPIIAVGSLSICMNINGWEGMLFIGINAAMSVRVSNELGSGRPRATKYAVIVTVIQSLLIGIICALVILATKNHFAIIFTDSKEMIQAVSKLAGLLGITMVLNSVQPVISGVAVGGGWQALVAYINLFCYYILGLPLGFLFGYKLGYRVEGIWVGMICGTGLQTLILLYIVYKTNWNKEVEQASERMRQWTGQELEINGS
ncbi:hypothetical protein RJT34_18010 [Clitoria ternatea]|uniref:Protein DETOXIFICATION n=1 Tax=Clitoria ternatea TaxID=43366 RepID=A0AAN9JBA9_CLITE